MDPVSAAANIIAIIHATNRLIHLCQRLLAAAQDAPSELRVILIEVSTLRSVLKQLELLVSCNEGLPILDALALDNGPIEGCRKVISELESLLPAEPLARDSKRKAALAAFTWILKEHKAKALLDELREYKNTIALALATDSSLDVKEIQAETTEIKRNTEKIFATLTDVQELHIYNWLHATDPSVLHDKFCDTYESGTGEWLFRSPEWDSWLEGKTRCLWVHGIPGAGKTIFASHLIETVRDHCADRGPRYACVYYYCYFGHAQDETTPLLRWILLELCRQLGRVPLVVYEVYRHGGQPNPRSLLRAIQITVQSFDRVYLFVDALDESLQRHNLLRILRDFATDPRLENLRVLATSREYVDIEEAMLEISIPISMRNYLLDQDIALYVRSRLASHRRLKRWPDQIREDVAEALSTKANGMFRWVVCQLDALQRLKPESSIIEAALANLPRTLDETYERVLLCVPEESRLFVRHALQWLSTHRTIHQAIPGVHPTLSCSLAPIDIPSGLDIPCNILLQAVQDTLAEDSSSDAAVLRDYAFDEELLRELCGCLVTVTDYPISKPGSNTEDMPVVSFAHYTVLEFLESARIRSGPAASFALDREQIVAEHTPALLNRAAESADRWTSELPQHPGVEYYSDFDRYCAHSAVLLLHWQGGILASASAKTWMANVVQLLEKRAACIGSYFWYSPEILFALENPLAPAIRAFRQTLTFKVLSQLPEPHLEILVRLLHLDERGSLAQILLATRGQTSADLAYQLHVEFQPGVFYKSVTRSLSQEEYRVYSTETLRFRGTILELYTHLPSVSLVHRGEGLHNLLEFAMGHFDPSTLMLLAIPNLKHSCNTLGSQRCWACLVVTRLLQLGAQPTVPGFAVGPLQIAVALGDFETTRLLLEAGVDPDGIGDLHGDIGTPETGPMLKWFKDIVGRSALNIVKGRHFGCLKETNINLEGGASQSDDRLEAVLIQYGGRDFLASLDGEGSLVAAMEMVGMTEDREDEKQTAADESKESMLPSL